MLKDTILDSGFFSWEENLDWYSSFEVLHLLQCEKGVLGFVPEVEF